jgi:hypothetical protein
VKTWFQILLTNSNLLLQTQLGPLRPGERMPNALLMLHYGFLDPGNPNDRLPMEVMIPGARKIRMVGAGWLIWGQPSFRLPPPPPHHLTVCP